jgi:hypothetical protein
VLSIQKDSNGDIFQGWSHVQDVFVMLWHDDLVVVRGTISEEEWELQNKDKPNSKQVYTVCKEMLNYYVRRMKVVF